MAEVVDQWPNIHQDMLKEIAKRLYSYDDYLQLRLVCKQWNFKLPKIPVANKSPWLLLPVASGAASPKEEDIYRIMQLPTIFEATFDTHSLQDKGIYHLTLQDLQYKLIRGSCYGWLIIVSIYEGTITMLNPWTKACLDLPPTSNLPDVIHDGDECTYFLGPYKIIEHIILANQILVWKVVINSAPMYNNDNDFLAVAIYGASRLAFYEPKNMEWIKLSTSHLDTYFQDVIFFEEKIYALDDEGKLHEFHVNTNVEPVGRVHEVTPPSDIVSQEECPNLKYLVGCADGSLLMVVRHFKNLKENGKKGCHETIKIDIYELKKNAKAWSRISSLGDYVLVIGFNASVQILAADLSNCKGNQIYFTDNEQTLENHKCYHNIGIFNLEDESCQTVLSDVNFFSPPVWIFP